MVEIKKSVSMPALPTRRYPLRRWGAADELQLFVGFLRRINRLAARGPFSRLYNACF
jgi:hypothetical protein